MKANEILNGDGKTSNAGAFRIFNTPKSKKIIKKVKKETIGFFKAGFNNELMDGTKNEKK